MVVVQEMERQDSPSEQPVCGLFGQASTHERALSFVYPTASHPMVVPERQNGKQISSEMTMDSNEGTNNAVPVLHGTAGSDRLIPGRKEFCHHRLPSGWKIGDQWLGLWPQDGS